MGTCEVKPAAVTPGAACRRSSMASNAWSTRSPVGYAPSGSVTRAVSTPAGSKPSATRCRCHAARSSRPAPTMSVTARATSAATSTVRIRSRATPEPDLRPPSRITPCKSVRAARSAGTRPKITALARVSATAKTSTAPSTRAWKMRGRRGGPRHREQLRRPTGDRNAADGAGGREHEAFGQQLADDPPSARAERGAHGELARAARAAGQQEVGDVGARDEQHAGDGAQPGEQAQPHILDQRVGVRRSRER